MKLHIRYAKKSDVPAGAADYYSPVKADDPEGAQQWDGFEPDPNGFAVVNATKLQQELAKLKADKGRADAALGRYKKPDADELWTAEELAELAQAKAQLAELQGKIPNVDDLRKQTAAEVAREYQSKVAAIEAKAKHADKLHAHYKQELAAMVRRTTAAQSLTGLKPQKGLEDVAMDRFAQDLDVVEVPVEGGEEGMVRFAARVRGPNGIRVDANGEPLDPKAYARGEFLRSYAPMFEPISPANGTGASGSNPGAAGRQPAGQHGSGQFRMTQQESLNDVGAVRARLKQIPKTDGLQILGQDGKVVAFRPGEA